jgi:hypothetical protein
MTNIEKRILEDGRHWFHNAEIDLYLWFEGDSIIEVQLTYDKSNQEKMIHWKRLDSGEKLSHCEVDDGEENPSSNLSPIVKNLCVPIGKKFQEMLTAINWEIEDKHKEFFLQKISALPTVTD